ncbi:hypothetical protein P4520_26765, partial [Bacillus thuringiensis]
FLKYSIVALFALFLISCFSWGVIDIKGFAVCMNFITAQEAIPIRITLIIIVIFSDFLIAIHLPL